MNQMVLGIDIGGSHTKAAPVDTDDGELVTGRSSLITPSPGTPDQVLRTIGELADRFAWCGPVGVTFPGVVEHGVIRTAAHLDQSWVGVDLSTLVTTEYGVPCTALNDADAAGLAEVRFGSGFGHPGVVVVVTLGTGVGTGVFVDGVLVPNTELGHLELNGQDMEELAASRTRTDSAESWKRWGSDVGAYLRQLENLLWPSLIVIGGGVSTEFDRFDGYLDTRTPVVAAKTGNDAGIIGAALAHRAAQSAGAQTRHAVLR
jgi:polyphosphate glucokinase